MKKLIFLFCLPLFAFQLADWIPFAVDEQVSVSFPNEPAATEVNGNKVWVSQFENGSKCMVMVLDFGRFGMDSASLSDEMDKPESFDQFRDGILKQIAGSSLISEKKMLISGYKTFEYVINMGRKDTASLNTMYNRNIFIGSKMYTLSFYEKEGQPQDANREQFMASFRKKN